MTNRLVQFTGDARALKFRFAVQIILKGIQQVVGQTEGAVALAVSLDFGEQTPQGVGRDILFPGHFVL